LDGAGGCGSIECTAATCGAVAVTLGGADGLGRPIGQGEGLCGPHAEVGVALTLSELDIGGGDTSFETLKSLQHGSENCTTSTEIVFHDELTQRFCFSLGKKNCEGYQIKVRVTAFISAEVGFTLPSPVESTQVLQT